MAESGPGLDPLVRSDTDSVEIKQIWAEVLAQLRTKRRGFMDYRFRLVCGGVSPRRVGLDLDLAGSNEAGRSSVEPRLDGFEELGLDSVLLRTVEGEVAWGVADVSDDSF